MQVSTRQIVVAGVMSAIAILLAIIPVGPNSLGFIPFFLGTSITIMHIPVIIGAVLQGPWVGLFVGLIFGLSSMLWAYIRPTGGDIYFQNPFISVLPRLFIGLEAYLVYRLAKQGRWWQAILALVLILAIAAPVVVYGTTILDYEPGLKVLVLVSSLVLAVLALAGLILARQQGELAAVGAAAVAGTLTNTVLVLTAIGLAGSFEWVPPLPSSLLLALGLTNGLPEIIAAVIVSVAVIAAWKQIEVGRKGARIFQEEG
ncbi:MAG: ECF transporter S component [Chloroflexia bacterium]|nr:ECF transporter S component [Chloroflexia bacterium]